MTVGIFVALAVISAASFYSGNPIVCKDGDAYAEQLCWLHGARNFYSKAPDACFSDPNDKSSNPGTEYYVWVSMVLFLNGVFFMVPYKLWQYFEDGMLKQFGDNRMEFLNNPKVEGPENRNQTNGNRDNITNSGAHGSTSGGSNVVANTGTSQNPVNITNNDSNCSTSGGSNIEVTTGTSRNPSDGKHVGIFKNLSKKLCRKYFYTFVACEMLNICIAIISFVFTNAFLSGHLFTYGANVIGFSYAYKTYDPMCSLFPTVVNCEYSISAVNGNDDSKSGACILGQNILNQKIYFLLWVWFMVLFFASGYVIDRIMCILCQRISIGPWPHILNLRTPGG